MPNNSNILKFLASPIEYASPSDIEAARTAAYQQMQPGGMSQAAGTLWKHPFEALADVTKAVSGRITLASLADKKREMAGRTASNLSDQVFGPAINEQPSFTSSAVSNTTTTPNATANNNNKPIANVNNINDYVKRLIQIESSGNPQAVTGSYRGLGMFGKDQEAKYGITDWTNSEQQIKAIAQSTSEHRAHLKQVLGREPTWGEVYLSHQQGQAGATAHLTNPEMPAWQNLYRNTGEYRKRGPNQAKQAIWGNIPNGHPLKNKPVDEITSAEFTQLWKSKFGDAPAQTARMNLGAGPIFNVTPPLDTIQDVTRTDLGVPPHPDSAPMPQPMPRVPQLDSEINQRFPGFEDVGPGPLIKNNSQSQPQRPQLTPEMEMWSRIMAEKAQLNAPGQTNEETSRVSNFSPLQELVTGNQQSTPAEQTSRVGEFSPNLPDALKLPANQVGQNIGENSPLGTPQSSGLSPEQIAALMAQNTQPQPQLQAPSQRVPQQRFSQQQPAGRTQPVNQQTYEQPYVPTTPPPILGRAGGLTRESLQKALSDPNLGDAERRMILDLALKRSEPVTRDVEGGKVTMDPITKQRHYTPEPKWEYLDVGDGVKVPIMSIKRTENGPWEKELMIPGWGEAVNRARQGGNPMEPLDILKAWTRKHKLETEAQQNNLKATTEDMTKYRNHAQLARELSPILDVFDQLENVPATANIHTGPMAPFLLDAYKVINDLGASVGIKLATPEKITIGELMSGYGTALAATAARRADPNPTLQQFTRMLANNPGIVNSPEYRKVLVGLIRQQVNRDITLGDASLETHPSEWTERKKAILADPIYKTKLDLNSFKSMLGNDKEKTKPTTYVPGKGWQ